MHGLVNDVCWKCTDRVLGCHSTCERYLAERKKLDDIRKKSEANRVSYEYACEHHDIAMKKWYKKKYYAKGSKKMRVRNNK